MRWTFRERLLALLIGAIFTGLLLFFLHVGLEWRLAAALAWAITASLLLTYLAMTPLME